MAEIKPAQKIQELLAHVKGKKMTSEERGRAAIDLATGLMQEAWEQTTHAEKKRMAQLAGMIHDPKGKPFMVSLTDQGFRSRDPARIADQEIYLLNKFGIPRFLSISQRLQFWFFKMAGKKLPAFFVPLVKKRIQHEASRMIVSAESKPLAAYLSAKAKEGVKVNLNHLGEAILGEQEAGRRLKVYLDALADPMVEQVSVKISTLYSQIHLIAKHQTLQILSERLKQLYRAARQNKYLRANGTSGDKFVTLDMEEYRDLHLTVTLFKAVLDDPEFFEYSAGIALQSYLPDSFALQKELTEWAMIRVSKGGAPIKIRLVKGANLGMEQVEASHKNWPQAPYENKIEADANFKHMLVYACQLDRAKAVRVGIGSHNVFDIAFALLLRAERSLESYVGFEMLEGMASALQRTVQKYAQDMLLYSPVASPREFQCAVAYLIRRLDENTSTDNFLRRAFHLHPGSQEWQQQANLFLKSLENIDSVPSTSRRTQNRLSYIWQSKECASFENEPDTDWSIEIHGEWAKNIHKEWSQKVINTLPLVVDGQEVLQGKEEVGEDPSFPGIVRYQYTAGTPVLLDRLLECAKNAAEEWKTVPIAEKSAVFADLANVLRMHRADLIGAMAVDGGKSIQEADSEVSEAIDFAEYYRRNMEEVHCMQDVRWRSKGVALIAPPWNFPCSIPAGSLIAALASGCSVIFKPAPETVLCGWILAKCFWEAGFNKKVFQFFPCADEPVGTSLIRDPRIAAVLLTGSTETAKAFLQKRPGLDLFAETGGKNTLIISRMSDRDQAIKDLIVSAFGHSGQKCSACSLAICEAEVYDDPAFLQSLKDAAQSLVVGSQWNLSAKITPLIRSPNPTLMRALTELEPGEEWLLEPKRDVKNPQLWSPGIKLGVKPGSFTYMNELFGPVLGVMRAENLQQAINYANGTPFGLTAGLHSLDEREHEEWLKGIEAGNLYINRTLTGAIVQRQPFGGTKQSSFGRGAKIGGPNYLMQLMDAEQIRLPTLEDNIPAAVHALHAEVEKQGFSVKQLALWKASIQNYAFFWNQYFQKNHDPALVLGQDNFLCYVPHRQMTLRVQAQDEMIDVYRVIAAALTCGMNLEISGDFEIIKGWDKASWVSPSLRIISETEGQWIQRLKQGRISRLRLLQKPSEDILSAAAASFCHKHIAPVLSNGRVELLHYLREVSVSIDYHRYGNLGSREHDKRHPLITPERFLGQNSAETCLHPVCCSAARSS